MRYGQGSSPRFRLSRECVHGVRGKSAMYAVEVADALLWGRECLGLVADHFSQELK